MLADLLEELSARSTVAILGLASGSLLTLCVGWWKRRQQHRSILAGDARDTIVIQHHIVTMGEPMSAGGAESQPTAATLRIRSLGQSELGRVVPNGYLAGVLLGRAFEVTSVHTLISMEGSHGSYCWRR
jgi:hypothetical protein